MFAGESVDGLHMVKPGLKFPKWNQQSSASLARDSLYVLGRLSLRQLRAELIRYLLPSDVVCLKGDLYIGEEGDDFGCG